MIIRKERVGDVPRIHQLTRDAFLNAPHTDHTEQFIVDALRSAGALSISLVAERAGEVLGHVAVSPVTISDGTTGWFGLGPVSVAPAEQGAGIGSALMQAALAELKQLGARGCVLLGVPAFYRRFGFRPAAPLVLTDVPPEYFQAVLFAGELPRGEVSYHPAFAARVQPLCLCYARRLLPALGRLLGACGAGRCLACAILLVDDGRSPYRPTGGPE